uniref:Uncharacterized protein n=1 Tax=Chromera velia CCMP2878 TaxID=1169474 RepID=A0A0G4FI38_9ALVE|eukprot:Cvel_3357.t1-p1 / transcript=Cvel_3357.t1 / gene=Cvel_3357 / organism=Chromera_velia_CCMP2878 / gene_product=hypothetical protein / transcript_product=hypothetical protein / location=Cvel_scaffold134:25271-27862(+) / protein_length=176 / sequence_SO=supercontig / SO=protein_coding / is_pseudo=false
MEMETAIERKKHTERRALTEVEMKKQKGRKAWTGMDGDENGNREEEADREEEEEVLKIEWCRGRRGDDGRKPRHDPPGKQSKVEPPKETDKRSWSPKRMGDMVSKEALAKFKPASNAPPPLKKRMTDEYETTRKKTEEKERMEKKKKSERKKKKKSKRREKDSVERRGHTGKGGEF